MKKLAAPSVILAGILWGVISIFIKKLSAAGFDSLQICLIRMIVAAISVFIFLLIKSPSLLKINIKDIWMFIGTGIISIVLFNSFYFYTMVNSEASVAVVLLYTSPVFIMILSAVIFKEKLTFKKLIALFSTVLGCVLVSGMLSGSHVLTTVTLFTGLASGLFYALYTIFGKFALKKYNTATVTAYTFLFGLIGSVPLGKPSALVSVISADYSLLLWCIGIGIISTTLPYVLYTFGLNRMDSGKASILVAVEPLVGALLGIFFYNESHDALKIIGILLILLSIILLSLPDKKEQPHNYA